MNIRQVNVGEGDGAAVGEVSGRGDQFGNGAGDVSCSDNRYIIGAGNGDSQGAACGIRCTVAGVVFVRVAYTRCP